MKKYIFLILLLSCFKINAHAANYNMYLNTNDESVLKNTTKDIYISLDNIVVPNGLNTCQANISSSNGIIINNISGLNGWNATNGNALVLDSSTNALSNTNIAKINVTINNEGNINISNIVCTNGEEEFSSLNTSISFKLKQEETNNSSIVTNNVSKNVNTTTTKVISTENTFLSELSIEDVEFVFDKNILKYNIEVDNNIDEVKLHYQTENNNATVTLNGKTDLVIGKNIIEIIVANGKQSRKYILNINKIEIKNTVNNVEEEILKSLEYNKLVKVNVDYNDKNKIISSKIMSLLKKEKKDIIYQIYDKQKKIYSFKIEGKYIKNTQEINFNIKFKSNYDINPSKIFKSKNHLIVNLDQKSLFPKNVEIIIYNSEFKKDTYLYLLNPNNKIEFLHKIKSSNKGIILNLDYGAEFILSEYKLSNNKFYLLYSSFFVILLMIVLILIKIIKFKKQ